MSATTTNFRTDEAAVHLDAANSIEDTHFEGFYDGIVVGDTASAAGSSILHITSGNGSGPVINTVHVCNPASLSGACTNYSGSSTANLGGTRLATVAKECELLVREGGITQAAPIVARIRKEHQEFCCALTRERSPNAA